MNRKEFLSSMSAGALALFQRPSITGAATAKDAGRPVPLRAVVPATLTAFDRDGQLDIREFRRHVRDVADVPGVSAIVVNGAAGHASVLNRDERRRLLGEALAVSRVPIVAAVSETADNPTLAPLAKDAEAEGAYAMMIMPPASKDYAWESERARYDSACSASSLPVVVYQIGYDTETLTRLAALPPVFAVKEGTVNFERNLRAIRALGRNVAVWSTHSSSLLAHLATGADGILSGMGSVTPDLHVALAEAISRSDLATARKVSDRIFPLTQVFYRSGQDPHVRMQYALTKLGRQKHDFVRPPLKPLDETERVAVDRALTASGIL